MQHVLKETTSPVLGTTFQRKFAVEFINNIEALKKKTSHSKKTCRALFAFFTERVAAEQAYAARLATLAKNGGISVSFGYSYSIVDYKNNEEATLQNALNSLLDFTIQESEFHKNFAEELKEKVLQPLHEIRVKLSKEKENWLCAIDTLKKNLATAQEKLRQEQLRLKSVNQEIEVIKERKRRAMAAIGLDPTDEIALNNLPGDIQKLERAIIEKAKRKKETADSCEASTTSASQTEEHYKGRMKRILNIVEQDESLRINILKRALTASNEAYLRKLNNKSKLCEIVGNTYTQINSAQDIQNFIRKDSLCTTNEEELRGLYKIMGEDLHLATKQKSASELLRRSEQQRQLADKINKALAVLKHLRIRSGRQEELCHIYPPVSVLKKINIHSELKGEDQTAVKLFMYAAYEFAVMTAANNSTVMSPFRTTLGSQTSTDHANKNVFGKILAEKWNLSETQIEYVKELLKPAEELKVKSWSFYNLLLHLIGQWTKVLSNRRDKQQETGQWFYKGVYAVTWGYIFWQVFNKVGYKDDEFEVECSNLLQLLEFNSYMAEASLATDAQFAEFTLKVLQSLQNSRRYSLKPAIPITLRLFQEYVAPVFIEEKEERLLKREFDQLMEEARPFYETLGLELEWAYAFFLRHVSDHYVAGTDYKEREEKQMKGLRAMLDIKKYIESNHPEFLSPLKMKNNDLLEPTAELYERIEKAGVLLKVAEFFESSLTDFKGNFGKCTNKLKVVLDLGRLLHTSCHVLPEEETYDAYLGKVLVINGQKCLASILEIHKRPFILISKEDESKASTIPKIVSVFKAEVLNCVQKYFGIWAEHVSNPESYYSKPMREVLSKDLQGQATSLSIDSSQTLFSETSVILHEFDCICHAPLNEATTGSMLPQLKAWLSQKSTLVYEKIRKGYYKLPSTTGETPSTHAVDVAYYIYYILETVKANIDEKALSIWPDVFKQFIANIIKEYCTAMEKTCQNSKEFLPGPLPPLSLANRRRLIGRSTRRIREEVKGIDKVFNENWNQYLSDDSSIVALCSKITDLSFMNEQIQQISAIYFPKDSSMEEIRVVIERTTLRVLEYLAYKLTFVDLGTTVYNSLYTGEPKHMGSLATGLYMKLDVFKTLRKKVSPQQLKDIMNALLKGLIHGWLHYILILLTNTKAEEMKDMPGIVVEDMRQLKEFFCDSGDRFKGLSIECIKEMLRPMDRFVHYIRTDDNALIGQYKNISAQDEAGKELIVRILFGRGSKEVERFFELYKNILTK